MASLENDAKEEHTFNDVQEEQNCDDKKEELSSDDGASSVDEAEHHETMEVKGAEIAQFILEELQGLRVDMRNEIQAARDQITKLLYQPKDTEDHHESTDIASDKAPAASAQKRSVLSPSTSVASTEYSNFVSNRLNFVPEANDLMDCEPSPSRTKGLAEFDDDLDEAIVSDGSLTPPNSNTNIPTDSISDFAFGKQKPDLASNVLEKPGAQSETMLIDPIGSESCNVETVTTSNTTFQHCKKTSYDFMKTENLNTDTKPSNQEESKTKQHSLGYFDRADQKHLDSQSCVTRTSTQTNKFVDENILTTKSQESNKSKYQVTTSTSMSADIFGVSCQEEEQKPCVDLPQHATKVNINVALRKNRKHDIGPSLCMSAKNAIKNKIISTLKAKLHNYELANATTVLAKPVECEFAYKSANLVDKNSTTSREATSNLNNFEVENGISEQTFENSCTESIDSSSCENLAESPFVKDQSEGEGRRKSEIKFLPRPTTALEERSIAPQSKLCPPAQKKSMIKEKCTKFRCDICERLFSYSWLLKDHMRLHSNQLRNKCQICKKSFPSERARNRHLLSVHFDAKCFECIQCGKFYSTKEGLARHKKSHEGLKPFTCTICDESFISDSQLQRHASLEHKSVNSKPFQCDTCNKSFYSEAGLKRHSRIHTGEKPFPCKKCGRHFRSADNLDRHLMTHSDGKQHNCRLCKRTFGNSASLKRHLLIYHEEKKFVCKKCGKSFAHFHYLKFHMKNHADQGQRQRGCKRKKTKKRTSRKKRRYSR